ncbi:hypothetical protein BHM03_00055485 [Ensete ventricosum]|nr:hypothetical protein BHM03_00055485 [Ensete ventricosum]
MVATEYVQGVLSQFVAKQLYEASSKVLIDRATSFKLRLHSSSHMSYEYGYRVTLARFRAKYPDLKVEENPFTRLTEDDAVSMEEEVSFDDSLAPLEA